MEMLQITKLQAHEIVWPSDCIKSIEKLCRWTYRADDRLYFIIWWLDLDVFDTLYHKTRNDDELREEIKIYSEEQKTDITFDDYDFIRLF